jgi:GNAT superfamily N-acetyltransferase
VGYFELESQAGGNVEISYFGLLPESIGKGLGGALLSAAVEGAWKLPDTRRVWVHTCTHDHEHALANYLKRGFRIFKTEEESGGA